MAKKFNKINNIIKIIDIPLAFNDSYRQALTHFRLSGSTPRLSSRRSLTPKSQVEAHRKCRVLRLDRIYAKLGPPKNFTASNPSPTDSPVS